jgi:hypothetical protein
MRIASIRRELWRKMGGGRYSPAWLAQWRGRLSAGCRKAPGDPQVLRFADSTLPGRSDCETTVAHWAAACLPQFIIL